MSLSCLIIFASSGLRFPVGVGSIAWAVLVAIADEVAGGFESTAGVLGGAFVAARGEGCDESVILSELRFKMA